MDDVLCLIPARAGSKGIPHKNIRKVNGVPLVIYSIRQAINSGIPKKNIIVSSDDNKVLEFAFDYGVIAYKRPEELCQDKSTTELAMIDVVKKYSGFRSIMVLQPTSPIRLVGRIEDAVKHFNKDDYDSLISTTKLHKFFWDHTGKPTYDIINRPMKQDLKESDFFYHDNGCIYITKIDFLLNKTKYISCHEI